MQQALAAILILCVASTAFAAGPETTGEQIQTLRLLLAALTAQIANLCAARSSART